VSIEHVLSGKARVHVERGDCLRLLRSLPDDVADAVVTDPPYSSGALHARARAAVSPAKKYKLRGKPDFAGDDRDQMSFALWCTLWLAECYRVSRPGAPVCVFSDWRQLAITANVLQAAGFVLRGIVPWDKTEGVRPQRGRFRQQAEYVVWGSKGPMSAARKVPVLPGVIREGVNYREKRHLTGKPVAVMRRVVQICEPDGLVVDPFCGSGSTGIACRHEGLRFLGMELTETYAAIARGWLAEPLERTEVAEVSRARRR
jgi:site-specific DNA-methyltransferase (adenine-specific)